MKKRLMCVLVACVFALTLGLVGCGGGAGGNADSAAAAEAFAGTWDLVGMEENGDVTSAEDLQTLRDLGMDVYLQLDEDGTASLVLFGESMDGTWEAATTTSATITMENQGVNATIDGGTLTMEQDGAKMTFEKGEPRA